MGLHHEGHLVQTKIKHVALFAVVSLCDKGAAVSSSIKDTFAACLCRGDALDHSPESCLFVLVFPTLVHLPPCHGNSSQIVKKNNIFF